MDGRTDGFMDGELGRQINGRTRELSDEWINRQTDTPS